MKEKGFDVGLLYLGVLLGMAANFIVNVADRHLVKFGIFYDLASIALSFVIVWAVSKKLDKTFGEK